MDGWLVLNKVRIFSNQFHVWGKKQPLPGVGVALEGVYTSVAEALKLLPAVQHLSRVKLSASSAAHWRHISQTYSHFLLQSGSFFSFISHINVTDPILISQRLIKNASLTLEVAFASFEGWNGWSKCQCAASGHRWRLWPPFPSNAKSMPSCTPMSWNGQPILSKSCNSCTSNL